ncbi:MAG: cytochrome c-type biogenesis protein CcmH, partial [Thermomicrobiaceae bacterium]|nr:cytochrome c-type biogenesis protein CcmH [Thermomicrobiaceae bacterium]
MKRSILLGILTLLLLALPAGALADEALSPEALEIANSLNCPVCEGQSVRDSGSQLAQEMRQVIQQKVEAGESRQQILDYFVQRYGVGILREPPKRGFTSTLWIGPIVGLLAGALILGTFVLQRRRVRSRAPAEVAPDPGDAPDLRPYEERFLRELE